MVDAQLVAELTTQAEALRAKAGKMAAELSRHIDKVMYEMDSLYLQAIELEEVVTDLLKEEIK